MFRNIIYKINWSNCDLMYYGQTKRAAKTRISEHKRAVCIFDANSKVSQQVYQHNHNMDSDNVLKKSLTDLHVTITTKDFFWKHGFPKETRT